MAATGKELPPPVPKKKLSAVSLLPSGSEFQGVMLPRYDENRRLTGVLKAKTMTLVTEEVIAGETVSIEFFNPDRSPRGRIDLVKAVLNQGKGLLRGAGKRHHPGRPHPCPGQRSGLFLRTGRGLSNRSRRHP